MGDPLVGVVHPEGGLGQVGGDVPGHHELLFDGGGNRFQGPLVRPWLTVAMSFRQPMASMVTMQSFSLNICS